MLRDSLTTHCQRLTSWVSAGRSVSPGAHPRPQAPGHPEVPSFHLAVPAPSPLRGAGPSVRADCVRATLHLPLWFTGEG